MLDAPPSNNVAKCPGITSNYSSNSGKSLVRSNVSCIEQLRALLVNPSPTNTAATIVGMTPVEEFCRSRVALTIGDWRMRNARKECPLNFGGT
ncbi:hypothetical protein F443_13712 [Phytophthora nicotianae P1569]|uniref:Uncharacterized protein n=2 Tax=Phytophthora nicotianae TaxID=4792 RepID=V9EP70_PHYNI|nr:hypothetical protein F443_13712 [Phytophthora nicotianae P1569]ETO69694.1 hypothetical protein F444_13768 [Phytophthora nicotianae P1976]